jgi:outer membrane murein-binding lipoprotein Lpp
VNPKDWPAGVLLFLAGQLVTAGGTYAAIRADLREAIVSAHNAEQSAARANDRIDRIAERR